MRYVVLVVALAACSKKDAAPAGGTASCLDVLTCYKACPQMTGDCTSKCDALGTAEARAANLALIACFGANNCQDESCLTTKCGAEFQACASAAAAPAAPATPPAAPAGAGVDDKDFVFIGEDGLTYVPPLEVVTHGVAVGLAGVWRDTLHNVSIELGAGTYTLQIDEAGPRSGVTHVETGSWNAEGSSIVLTPASVTMSASQNLRQEKSEAIAPDPPRTWTLEGVTLQWTSMGPVHETHRVDGIVVTGPAPSWSSGTWSFTMRRAK